MKRMKYISMTAALVSLCASSLLAQESGAPTPPAITAQCDAPLASRNQGQASKPSPEFRSYVRLLALNILTDSALAAAQEKVFVLIEADLEKNSDLFAQTAIKAFNATPRASLQGEEKAFVDDVSQWLLELYASYQITDPNNQKAQRALDEQIFMTVQKAYLKYPQVFLSGVGAGNDSNFFDAEKLGVFMAQAADDMRKLKPEERSPVFVKCLSQLAEMIGKNEI